jgi:hypothetical protein
MPELKPGTAEWNREVLRRAHALAAQCGCRNWRSHRGVAQAQLEQTQKKNDA